MLILDLFKMALRSLIAISMRTFLTALGMIIGVASVISMISIGEGARQQTLSTIEKFGTNIITIKPGRKKNRHVSSDTVKTLKLSDAKAIEKNIPLNRLAEPIDIVKPILFLCSSLSSYMTGCCLDINGGQL